MSKEYLILKCNSCKKTTIVLCDEVNRKGFLVCSHCSSKRVKVASANDSLKDCMKEHYYKRDHGALRQVK